MRPPSLATPRLSLIPPAEADVDALLALFRDPHVRRYLWDDEVIEREAAAGVVVESIGDFAERGIGLWRAAPADRDELIGFCGFRRSRVSADPGDLELLYGFAPAWCGRGLATEAARATLRFVFLTTGLPRIVAATDAPNAASARVLARLGFTLDRRGDLHGLDTLFYSLSRSAFVL
jgi:ribosomal-protein-alanine N-acetyltransferase